MGKRRNFTCGGCGQRGHRDTNCATRSTWVCKNCGQLGHGHWECPKPYGYLRMNNRSREQTGASGAFEYKGSTTTNERRCFHCGERGHVLKNCPQRLFNARCYICGETGHVASDCTGRKCTQCGVEGHSSESCRNPARWQNTFTNQMCARCGDYGHPTWWCNGPVEDELDTETDRGSAAASDSQRSRDSDKNINRTQKSCEDAAELSRQASIASASEAHDRAIDLYTKAIALDPNVSEFYTSRGIAYSLSKNFAAALGDFQSAISRGWRPTAEVLVCIARCRLHLGSPSSAFEAVREALVVDSSHSDAYVLKKRLQDLQRHRDDYHGARSRKHWRMARQAYESCLGFYAEEDGDLPVDIRCWNVEIRIAESDWEGAMKAIDHLFLREPKSTEVMIKRALLLLLTGKLEEALQQIVATLKLDPDSTPAKELRSRIKGVASFKSEGNDYFRNELWDDAIAQWDKALDLVGDGDEEGDGGLIRATLLLNKATAKLKLYQLDDGLKDANAALKLNPTYVKAFLTRARIQVGMELFESAIDDFTSAQQYGSSSMSAADRAMVNEERESAELAAATERNRVKDYYKILGLSRICTPAEIRKAYRVESLKHHPDKGGVAEKFKLVAEAYSTLSDDISRWQYDIKLARNA